MCRSNIWQNPIPFHDKNFQQIRTRRKFSQLIKGFYEKLRANIILNGFPLRSGKVIHSLLLFSYVLKFLAKALKARKKKKKHLAWKRSKNYHYLKKIWSCIQKILRILLTITRNNKQIHQVCRNTRSVYKNQLYSYRLAGSTVKVN